MIVSKAFDQTDCQQGNQPGRSVSVLVLIDLFLS